MAIEKSTTNQIPTKTDCELKKLSYFGSGLSIIITDPANTRLLLKLSHFAECDPSNQWMRAEFPVDLRNGLAWRKIVLSKRNKCEWQIWVILCILELFFWKKINEIYFFYFRSISKFFQEPESTKIILSLAELSTYVWKLLWLGYYLEKYGFSVFYTIIYFLERGPWWGR